MKKILFFLAFLALGILSSVNSEAQTTYTNLTRNTYSLWNMDTLGYNLSNNGTAYFYGESKVITVGTNNSIVIQGAIGSKIADSLSTGGFFLLGSMDNATWTRVPIGAANASSNVTVSFGKTSSPVAVSSGTWPIITQPTPTGTGFGAALTIASDSVALSTAYQSSSANGFLPFYINIERPQYTYYKVGVVGSTTNTNKYHQYTWFFKYYLRKPY